MKDTFIVSLEVGYWIDIDCDSRWGRSNNIILLSESSKGLGWVWMSLELNKNTHQIRNLRVVNIMVFLGTTAKDLDKIT